VVPGEAVSRDWLAANGSCRVIRKGSAVKFKLASQVIDVKRKVWKFEEIFVGVREISLRGLIRMHLRKALNAECAEHLSER